MQIYPTVLTIATLVSLGIKETHSACSSATCPAPGGFCDGPNDDTCFCHPGYYSANCASYNEDCKKCTGGKTCSRKGTLCARCRSLCSGHGECHSTPKGAVCLCGPGWSGRACEIELPTQKPTTEAATRTTPKAEKLTTVEPTTTVAVTTTATPTTTPTEPETETSETTTQSTVTVTTTDGTAPVSDSSAASMTVYHLALMICAIFTAFSVIFKR